MNRSDPEVARLMNVSILDTVPLHTPEALVLALDSTLRVVQARRSLIEERALELFRLRLALERIEAERREVALLPLHPAEPEEGCALNAADLLKREIASDESEAFLRIESRIHLRERIHELHEDFVRKYGIETAERLVLPALDAVGLDLADLFARTRLELRP